MLRTLYFVPDIMDRYKCSSKDTARRYMRQMGAKGKPLFVTEDMISEWEDGKRIHASMRLSIVPSGMKIPRRK